MTDQALGAALLKLQVKSPLPASQFTPVQRSALDRFARQTGAVNCVRQGRGDVYRICDLSVFNSHVVGLLPQVEASLVEQLPIRAQNIAHARNSKTGFHQHENYYPLLKSIGDSVFWREGGRGVELDLSSFTRNFGAATLRIQFDDSWYTEQPLWLVENQALFDRIDWMPEGTCASLLYYAGQIDGRLLSWLGHRPRASRVIFFPDYDGVGLSNFARLYRLLGDTCECWLMPDWESKLARYGSNEIWRDTFRYFIGALDNLPNYLHDLTKQMHRSGLALEHEAVWLPA